MLLLGTRTSAIQTVPVDGIINLGAVYRRYCKKVNGVKAFDFLGNSISLNQSGIYHLTASFVASGTAAGLVGVQMLENGQEALNVYAQETITTANTEFRTLVIDTYILVDENVVLGQVSTQPKNISFEVLNTEMLIVDATVNVEKVVGAYA